MDGSSQNPASAATLRALTETHASQWRGFVLFQTTFWGGFLAVRAVAAATLYPDLFLAFMAPRVAIVTVYAAVTSLIHVGVSRFVYWTPLQRLFLTLGLCG